MRKLTICVLLVSCVCLACSPMTMPSLAPTAGKSPATQPPRTQPLAEPPKSPTLTLSPATPKVAAPLPVESAAEATPVLQQAITGEPVTFEMVAQGDAMVGKRVPPFTVAVSATDQPPALLNELPSEARTVFEQAKANLGQSVLYLVIYGGRQPSGGYAVKIVSVTEENGKLTVLYRVDGPPPGQGAADVITYPYAIARVSGVAIDPADVTFVEQKSTP